MAAIDPLGSVSDERLFDEAGNRWAHRLKHRFGSFRFLAIQTVVVIGWMAVNTMQIFGILHFDPYPYILLNLAFSTQAAYAAPMILIAQNHAEKEQNALSTARHTEMIERFDRLERALLRKGEGA